MKKKDNNLQILQHGNLIGAAMVIIDDDTLAEVSLWEPRTVVNMDKDKQYVR
jgi:hypothetical protein